ARLTAFASTRRAGVRAEDDANLQGLVQAGTDTVCLVGKAWHVHVTWALETTLDENLAMVRDSVAFLKQHGKEVIFDAEHFFDGYKGDRGYALAVLEAAAEGGADWLVLCDTNGGTLPRELARIVAAVRDSCRRPLGIHCHDDAGLAVANSLAAVEEGCTMVQGTINGYGERCGNANLITVAANLQLKLGVRCLPDEAMAGLTELSHFAARLVNLSHREEWPYVGRNAFAHKAGLHVSALRKHASLYEHVPPEVVGNQRRIVVSELSGRANLQAYFAGFDLGADELKALLEQVKTLEHQGYQFEGAEASLELLLLTWRSGGRRLLNLEALEVVVDQDAADRARARARLRLRLAQQLVQTPRGRDLPLKLELPEQIVEAAAEGNGPVHALDTALRQALRECYPELERMRLVDYTVRVLEGDEGTGARVRVLVTSSDGRSRWGTVGVSTNIIQASWQALADSVEYFLRQSGVEPRLDAQDQAAIPDRRATGGQAS
ncbi:MAG TPA: citramalate synthase, partial [Bacillota bacterium]